MTDRSAQADVGAKIQNALRSHAGAHTKGYKCPLCNQDFRAGPKLWDHAKLIHTDSTEVTGFEDETQAKRRFLEKGQQRVADGKAITDPPRKASSSGKEITNSGTEGDVGYSDSNRLGSAPGYQEPDNKIDDIGKLTLEQNRPKGPHNRNTSANIPQKRAAGGELGSSEPPSEQYNTGYMGARAGHGKNPLGDDLPQVGYGRQDTQPDSQDFRRDLPGSLQTLFDPNTDNTNASRVSRRDKRPAFAKPSHGFQSSKGVSSIERAPQPFGKEQWPLAEDFTRDETATNQSNVVNSSELQRKSINYQEALKFPGEESPTTNSHPEGPELEPEMLLQPETRPISHEQLIIEVKGIYAGLVMVEAKCIDIDERQSAAAQEKDPLKKVLLKNDQWQSLIALHKQLLHEHHDFFLASQHPSASPALSRLAAKYSMPARMWRHGIHAFLEVLRHRLPESLEHMLAFIYIAYTMMALLYETVSAFEDTWIECLGDLGRYRMAIEDHEPKDRETWSNVARFWYNKAVDKSPNVGRLYHHLAILARPYSLEQLSLYTKSLTCIAPFESARGSIMTLFNPILQGKESNFRRASSFETLFIRTHGILFTSQPSQSPDQFHASIDELERDDLFDRFITKAPSKFRENGVYIAVSNIAALFEYGMTRHGSSKAGLREAFENARHVKDEASKPSPHQTISPTHVDGSGTNLTSSRGDKTIPSRDATYDAENLAPSTQLPIANVDNLRSPDSNPSSDFVSQSSRLTSITLGTALKRVKDKNVYPLVHVYLTFLWSLIIVQEACRYFEKEVIWRIIEKDVPWVAVCFFLNELAGESQAMTDKVLGEDFPRPEKEKGRPLPEDFVMRGQLYTQWYYPINWFVDPVIDDDERTLDLPSMVLPRIERILWLGVRIASVKRWICYDAEAKRFTTTDYVDVNLNPVTSAQAASHVEDSIMSDIGTSESDIGITGYTPSESSAMSDVEGAAFFTPRTMSKPPSESPDDSKEPNRAPTPTEVQVIGGPPHPTTPKTREVEESTDTPMMDISPRKEDLLQGDLMESERPDLVSRSQNAVVKQRSSPPLIQHGESQSVLNLQNLQCLVEANDREDAETYKP